MSSSALGKALGLSPSTILVIEKKGSKPETIKKLANYFRIPMSELLIEDVQSERQLENTIGSAKELVER
jgi:DNA-binding XRE family transcriptional regulator